MTASSFLGQLRWHPHQPAGQQLQWQRPQAAARLAPGTPVAQWPGRVAALHNLCAGAHRLCSTLALQALGVLPAGDTAAEHWLARDTLREHVRRLALDGPQTCAPWLDTLPEGEPLRADLLAEALAGPLLRADPAALDLDQARAWLESAWLGQDARRWWDHWCAHGWTAWHAWLPQAPGALGRLLRLLAAHEPQPGWSPPAQAALPLACDWPAGHTPTAPGHTGPWSRLMARGLWREHGAPGWSGLWAARLIEAVRLALPEAGDAWQQARAWRLGDQRALAAVDMARGVLVHELQVDNDKLMSARLLAPTDWNAAADGPLARSLEAAWAQQASTGDRTKAATLLAMWAAAADPCVPVALAWQNKETAHA